MFSWRNKKIISIFQMKKAPYLLLWEATQFAQAILHTQQTHNAEIKLSTLIQRQDIESTLNQRCFNILSPLGYALLYHTVFDLITAHAPISAQSSSVLLSTYKKHMLWVLI